MFMFINISIIIMLISIIIYLLNFYISKKMFNMREKNYPLECGFNMMNFYRLPFSIQFYYISILFLIFDVEISLILPMIQKLFYSLITNWMFSFSIIISILIIGLLIEWYNNIIKWSL